MRSYIIHAVAALIVAALTWTLIASPRIELAETKLEHSEQLSAERLQVINGLSEQLSKALILEQKNRETLAQIAQQSRAQARALQELKQNDEAIYDYLRQPVPDALGRLYQRAETTEPSNYRAEHMPVNTVQSAEAVSIEDK